MSSIMRNMLRAWYALRLLRLRKHRRPRDSAVIRSGDPRADRVLIVGNGFTHGWGVDTHRHGLSGRLSDSLADRTGRGCDVDVVGAESMNVRSSAVWLGDRALGDYDAVVVALGLNDALRRTPVAEWERGLSELLAGIVPRLRSDAAVLVAGIPPLRGIPPCDGLIARLAEGHRERLNATTSWIAELHGAAHVEVDEFATDTRGRLSPMAVYAQLGARLAAELAPALVAFRPDPAPRTPLPESEWEWSGAAKVLAFASDGGSPELKRLAETAERTFKVELAVVSLVNGERLYALNNTDVMPTWVPLELSFSRFTIVEESPVIVPDVRRDERFSSNPLIDTSFLHFYAGHPVRASDGRVIGSLCLYGSRAKKRGAVSSAALERLARDAEAELQRYETPTPPPAASSAFSPERTTSPAPALPTAVRRSHSRPPAIRRASRP